VLFRSGGDLPFHGEVGEELPDLLGAHLRGVTLPVEEDEAPDPAGVCPLCAQGEVAQARDCVYTVAQLWLIHSYVSVG